MGRIVRMSAADALAAGLIDPEVADLVRLKNGPASTPREPGNKKTQGDLATLGSPKNKRSRSRPASHPSDSLAPSGRGSVDLLADGGIYSADFIFDVVPVPKERAQIVKNPATNKVMGFTPARTKHFHNVIQRVIKHVLEGRPAITGPVKLDMTFVMQVPASWPRWKRDAALAGLVVPTGRPDMDNLEKALLDAFNRELIVDDAFVIERYARKIYGAVPSIRARVEKTRQLDIHATRAAVDALRSLMESINDGSG